jgi:hypothetical protein
MRKYIGIDIGKKGSIVVIDENGSELARHKMPMIKDAVDWHELNAILEPYEGFNGMVVYEKLGVIFGSSKKTAFSMGEQYGSVRMCCVANSIRYTEVLAKKWQEEIFQGQEKIFVAGSKTKVDTKAMALVAVKRLFPTTNLVFPGAQKPHDGFVDALLMAEYARRKFPR